MSSSGEISRRTNILIKNVDSLEQVVLYGNLSGQEDGVKSDPLSRAGIVLRNLTEYNVRSLCGAAVYGAGLQDYSQDRVSDKKFWKNTLSGKLDETGKKGDSQFFKPMITLERSAKSPRISGGCACSLARDGSLCSHMAALMIAWVRKPEEFVERIDRKSEFEEARQRVVTSLGELIKCVEKSSRTDDLRMLQKTCLGLKRWAGDVREARDLTTRELICELSGTLNYVSLAIMSALESKYGIGTIDLYNTNTVTTLARVKELLFVPDREKSSIPAKKKKVSPSGAARSWDVLVENFSGR